MGGGGTTKEKKSFEFKTFRLKKTGRKKPRSMKLKEKGTKGKCNMAANPESSRGGKNFWKKTWGGRKEQQGGEVLLKVNLKGRKGAKQNRLT